MSELQLFGTVTSPYVRRVRIVARELGVDYQLVDTFEEAGQEQLRQLNPIWKVPTARVQGRTVFDSRLIIRELLTRWGPGCFASDLTDLEMANQICVADGALDALINAFYLGKDGVQRQSVPYVEKQYQRAEACLAWLEARVRGAYFNNDQRFGLLEVAVLTALDWMRFRSAYPIERHAKLVALLEAHAARDSVAATRPPAA